MRNRGFRGVYVLCFFAIMAIGYVSWLFVQNSYHRYLIRSKIARGDRYLNSLTSADIQWWLKRTDRILGDRGDAVPMSSYDKDKAYPEDLLKLGVFVYDIEHDNYDAVIYCWWNPLGGPNLEVQRFPDHTYKVITHKWRGDKGLVIWP